MTSDTLSLLPHQDEGLYRTLLESMSQGAFVAEVQTRRLVFGNPAACRLFGYTPTEIEGLHVQDLHPEEVRDQAVAEFDAMVRGQSSKIRDLPCRRRDGSVFYADITSTLIRSSGRSCVAGFFDNVTERHRMSESLQTHQEELEQLVLARTGQLQESEQRYRTIVDNASDGIVILRDGRIHFANPRFATMMGCTAEELLGMPFVDTLHPDDHALVADRHRRRQAGESVPACYETSLQPRTGRTTPVEFRVIAVAEGGVPEFIVLIRDVTDRRQVEAHQAKLAHAWRINTLGQMASEIAHEINQPLCAISNYAGSCLRMTARETLERDRLVDGISRIAEQADRAGQIIRRIRAQAGHHEPKKTPLDINETVEEVLAMVRSEVQQRQVLIRRDLDASLPKVQADRIEIEQVILNLVRNGIEAMAEASERPRLLTVESHRRDGGLVEVAVSDSGPGLSDEVASRVFDSFFTTKSKGLGIGLPISKKIVEAHGGTLWADNNHDAACTFRFTLPVADSGD